MISLYRIGMKKFNQIKGIHQLDEYLKKLGFKLAENGAYYHKFYPISTGILNIGVICDNSNIYDLMAFGNVKNNIGKTIRCFENIYNINADAINTLSMIKTAGGLGLEGGSGGLHNINLDETFGGPRWWSYDSDEESLNQLETWITQQSRYNPEYLSIGRPIQIKEDSFTIIGIINQDIDFARLNVDRQEAYLEYISNNKLYKTHLPSFKKTTESGKYDGDFAQEIGKYQLKIIKSNGKSFILMRKNDTRGDIRGIWEINGEDSAPGFGYIDEDWKTSFSLHPEFLDDPNWTAGEWSPGRTRSNIL